jgi:hypothetical protein
MTAPQPVLSPISILPPLSSCSALIPARKNWARVKHIVISIFNYFFLNRLSLNLRNLKFLKPGIV